MLDYLLSSITTLINIQPHSYYTLSSPWVSYATTSADFVTAIANIVIAFLCLRLRKNCQMIRLSEDFFMLFVIFLIAGAISKLGNIPTFFWGGHWYVWNALSHIVTALASMKVAHKLFKMYMHYKKEASTLLIVKDNLTKRKKRVNRHLS